ncbi:helix-turn-helix transcriptional regulator [Salmonella enterica]|nr:helix-turn-helix transcriptional regulator [Salmonella enterica]
MEMFNVLPTRNEDAIGVLSSMLETAVFLRNSNFDRISSELIDASCEYINALKKYSQPYNHPKGKPTAVDLPTGYTPYNIGNRIQIARENLGMSEDDLAEKLNIHPGDVLAWEDSTDQLPAEMIIPLANALKSDPMWLLTGESSNRQISADSGK